MQDGVELSHHDRDKEDHEDGVQLPEVIGEEHAGEDHGKCGAGVTGGQIGQQDGGAEAGGGAEHAARAPQEGLGAGGGAGEDEEGGEDRPVVALGVEGPPGGDRQTAG